MIKKCFYAAGLSAVLFTGIVNAGVNGLLDVDVEDTTLVNEGTMLLRQNLDGSGVLQGAVGAVAIQPSAGITDIDVENTTVINNGRMELHQRLTGSGVATGAVAGVIIQ